VPRPCHHGVAEPQQEDEVNDVKVEGTICKKLLTGKKRYTEVMTMGMQVEMTQLSHNGCIINLRT
jgi:hypothetical protein